MKKMPWGKKKKHRQSFFSDQVIEDYSVTSCPCELYFPEPSVTFDELGAIKDVCLSGDALTLLWSKHCMVHLCEIQGVSPDLPFTLEDTCQDCEVCLSVVLNRSKSGDFSYEIRDKLWHEYSHKVGQRWRRFVLKFSDEDKDRFCQFEDILKDILKEVNKAEETKSNKLYLLVAVQTKLEKRKSSLSLKRHSKLSLLDLHQIGPDNPTVNETVIEPISPALTEESPSNSDNSSEDESRNNHQHLSLIPPFDPAPYNPDGDLNLDKTESVRSVNDDSAVFKSINHLCDSLHIHPNELPQTLSTILKSACLNSDEIEDYPSGNSKLKPEFGSHLKQPPVIHRWNRGHKKDIPERLNSEFIPTDELYIPMGYAAASAIGEDKPTIDQKEERKTIMADQSQQNPRLHKAQEVAQLLQTSINNSDGVHAQEYAKQLALENVIVTVDVKLKMQSPGEKDSEFILKVNIEDKESSGGTITLKVRATDTIRDLKNRMLMKHMFPVEVQYWIIGKRIPQDNETLEKCKIKHHGFTAFLYLISAKGAGINKEEFMRRQNLLLNPDFALAQPPQTPAPASVINQTPSRTGSSTTPGSGATGSASSGKPKMEPRILEENLNIAGKNEKRTPEKLPGQVQGKAQAPKLVKNEPNVKRVRQAGAEIAQVLNQIGPQIGAAVGGYPDTPYGESRQRIPVMHPEENEEPQQGWSCPACTYINQPTRPGCELCANARPAGYEIPPDYVVTEEEKKRLEMEALIERQTKEVPPGSQGRKYDSDSERDLDNLLQFHDALQDTLQRMPSNSPKRDSPIFGQRTLRRSSAGEIGSEDENEQFSKL